MVLIGERVPQGQPTEALASLNLARSYAEPEFLNVSDFGKLGTR